MENPASKNNQFLNRIYQDIKDNLDKEHYTVDDLARNVGLSRSMLHRRLKKITGKSAGTIIIEKRLETACDMLKNDDATISEIAYQVGLNSPSYFNKVFKKHFKVSPGDFKKHPDNIRPGTKIRTRGSFFPKNIKKYVWLVLIAGNILLIY
ncbi:MAG: helix-turn-helix domain-containing protein, partial [Bacteroidales bacterium]